MGEICGWADSEDIYIHYHNTDWGVPEYDSRALWEKLILDGFQAGLSWITILKKRENFREAFAGFDPNIVAGWGEADIERLLQNPGIIRSPRKIEACIGNAQAYLRDAEAGESFSDWCWAYVDGKPILGNLVNYRDGPTKTPISEACSKALKKKGYKYVGPTIVYAWLQACGLYNDHEIACPRYKQVQDLAR